MDLLGAYPPSETLSYPHVVPHPVFFFLLTGEGFDCGLEEHGGLRLHPPTHTHTLLEHGVLSLCNSWSCLSLCNWELFSVCPQHTPGFYILWTPGPGTRGGNGCMNILSLCLGLGSTGAGICFSFQTVIPLLPYRVGACFLSVFYDPLA